MYGLEVKEIEIIIDLNGLMERHLIIRIEEFMKQIVMIMIILQ